VTEGGSLIGPALGGPLVAALGPAAAFAADAASFAVSAAMLALIPVRRAGGRAGHQRREAREWPRKLTGGRPGRSG
jgi:hypothetical protein